MVDGIVGELIELQKRAKELGFKILEIEPTSLKSINLLYDSPTFLKDGDGNWVAPPREHGRVIGIRVIKSGKQEESDEMLSWKKLQLDHVLRTLRATDLKLFKMVDDGMPDLGDLHIMHFAIEACIARLEKVRGNEPIDMSTLKCGE